MGAGAFRLPRRGRARVRIIGVVVFLVIGAGLASVLSAFAAGSPSRPVDTDINKYVIFGLERVHLKSANSGVSLIKGGNIGVNNVGGSLELCGGGAHHGLKLDDGSQAVADNAQLQSECDFWDLFTNHLSGGSAPTLRNSGPNPATFPIISSLPTIPAFSCNTAHQTVAKNASVSLVPGTYGNLDVNVGATLTLSAGTYTFCEAIFGKNAKLVTTDGTVVQIAKNFKLNESDIIGPSCHAQFWIRGDGFTSDNDEAVAFSKNGKVAGKFWSLNGPMNLGNNTELTGNFWGKRVESDFDVHSLPCEEIVVTTTTTAPTTTST